ncbi:hypothetical protein CBS147346_4009 [Aspergillus niger]|nr:hypothetical protein CBS147346_4009 [Aspergillus niger]
MQSDIVSDFSNLALEEWHQRQKYVDTAKAEQTKNWTKLQLNEGKTQDLHTRTGPRPNFEPEDCCVMYPNPVFHHDPPGWYGIWSASSNQNVAFMMMETNPLDSSWGWAPLYWNHDIGNVWVARQDEQDLDVREVAMMCRFARHELQRIFNNVMISEGSTLLDKKRVLSFITRENMRAFWEETGGDEAASSYEPVAS